MLTLRPFTPADDAALSSWLRSPEELFLFTGPMLSWPLDSSQLDRIRSDPDARAWSAVDDAGETVGHIELAVTGERSARLVRVLIAPAHRGRGLGRELVAAAIAEARAVGVTTVTLNVVEGNAGAIHLYESLGFEHTGAHPERARVLTMRTTLR